MSKPIKMFSAFVQTHYLVIDYVFYQKIDRLQNKPIIKLSNILTSCASIRRSLSGVETSPIDIVVPKQLRSKSKSNPVIISDEDLDVEIEKVRSMISNGNLSRQNSIPTKSGTPSPVQEKQPSPVIESFSPVKQSVVQSPIKVFFLKFKFRFR